MQLSQGLLLGCLLAINKIIEDKNYKNNVGRLGHGLGLQLTEPPSHSFKNETKF